MDVKRGDIWLTNLDPATGSEQKGTRPTLVIQNDTGNKYSPTTIVAVLTSQIQKAKLPTHVVVPSKQTSLSKDSVILLEQIRTIDKQRFIKKLTNLNIQQMRNVDKALKVSLGLVRT